MPWPGDDNQVNYICVNVGSPVGWDDPYSVREGRTLRVRGSGVLCNDTDVGGDPLTANLVNNVSDGSRALKTDGSYTYTPDNVFTDVDSFTYTASDGTNDSDVAMVTITVNRGEKGADLLFDMITCLKI